MEGSIKKLVSDRGFGFIDDGSGKNVFFHGSSLTEGSFGLLRVGQKVTFEVEQSDRGPRAANVRVVS